jgi:uncharacterized protein
MKRVAGQMIYAPTDLTQFFDSEFACWMERYELECPDLPEAIAYTADPADDMQQILWDLGQLHEQNYLDHLQAANVDLCVVERRDAGKATLAAMQAGRQYIYQAYLAGGQWAGYADFLVRVEIPSALGDWSYLPMECKLAIQPKPAFIIQSCAYCDLLSQIQGLLPSTFQVRLGSGEVRSFRTEDYVHYVRRLRQSFLQQMNCFTLEAMPCPQGDQHGRWSRAAAAVLHQRDHLSQVANINRQQIRRLENAGITTVQHLAAIAPTQTIPKLDPQILQRLHHQARLQQQSLGATVPCYEVLPPREADPYKGLALLPPASPLDVYFDMEGYPLVSGGLEYLFGVTFVVADQPHYQAWWAHTPQQEKQAFEQFVDWVYARWQQDPQMHIYHYASYEAIALKRLMSRYATREDQVDDLLRSGVLVDLCRIVAQGVRVGGKNYSIKTLEKIYWQGRAGEVTNAQDSVVQYFRWLQQRAIAPATADQILADIRAYNQDDCDSTLYLTNWLRSLQMQHQISYRPRPGQSEVDPPQQISERQQAIAAVAQFAAQLLAEIPLEGGEPDTRWPLQELLAHLLQFHRREAKPFWWQRFTWLEMEDHELVEQLDCLAGIRRTDTAPTPIKQSQAYEYGFDPTQDTKLAAGTTCCFVPPLPLPKCTLQTLDTQHGKLTLTISNKKLKEMRQIDANWEPPAKTSLIPADFISTDKMSEAILDTVQTWHTARTLPPALHDLLERRSPRILHHSGGHLLSAATDALESIIQLVLHLDRSTLCIQGPPGSGKTYTAANIILRLLQSGKTVAVSSTSHKVISNLLGRVAELATQENFDFQGAKIGGKTEGDLVFNSPHIVPRAKLQEAHPPAFQLVGATVFQCCLPENQGVWDYLFVDEAGQVSLANLVAKARCAHNLVLMGDQMQLEQPIQGSHPGESGTSGLGYFLNGKATVPPDLGVFLDISFRMHPEICQFVSELVYEGRLASHPDTAHHAIALPPSSLIQKQNGILFMPVAHTDNTQASEEEVDQIETLVRELTGLGYTSDRGHTTGCLSAEEILIVAPYNLQVRKLQDRLGDRARIGTVDQFQGQEAPVVIVSMCASNGEVAPRGLEFLLNRNRLNVAISRAQCLAIVVGSPALATTPCTNLAQVELVNTFCKLVAHSS